MKTIERSAETCVRERKGDIFIVKRNPDPALHPFERAREYVRAVNAAKLDRLFAKPFVAALQGHVDGVYCMNRHPTELKTLASGAGDGELRLWDLSTKKCIWNRKEAHDALIRGVCFLPNSTSMLSCSDDKVVKMWDYSSHSSAATEPMALFRGKGTFTSIDSHRMGQLFATAGSQEVALWDCSRAEALQAYSWGADTVNCVRFNQAESALLASCASDRSLMIHDQRTSQTIAKVILKMRSNAVAWNPQEAFYLSAANEDGNVYTFDMRYFDRAINVMRGHVSAVLDLDYSPTGTEIATAGYDRSLRLFDVRAGNSRDIYHGQRMQRLFCVRFSTDSKYIFSGSDDGNVRIWKAHAAEQLGAKNHRQQDALDYNSRVLERFKQMPEVRRIATHRRIPKDIKIRARNEHSHNISQLRKEENRRRHSKPGSVPKSNIRNDAIVKVEK